MSRKCYSIEELGEIAELDPQDPRAAHLKECAHCRALLAACREFREPKRLPADADIEDAERRLAAVLERRIREGEAGGETAGTDEPRSAADVLWDAPHDGPLARLMRSLRRPGLKPALALAGSLAAILLVLLLVDFGGTGPEPPIVPRSERPADAIELTLRAPQTLESGAVRLSWQPVERADAYRILFFDADLNELARQDAGPAPMLVVQVDELVGLPPSETQILWQVVALRGGDELVRSRPAGLRLR